MTIDTQYLKQKWDEVSKDALILSSDYIKLPYVRDEDIVTIEYPTLDGSSEPIIIQDAVYSDLLKDGISERRATGLAFAVFEAVENAKIHAYKDQKTDLEGNLNRIYTGAIFTPKYDMVGVSSKSQVDLGKIREMISANEKIRYDLRGRGFFFMIKMCDVVHVRQSDEYMEVLLILMKDKFHEEH